MTNGASNDNLNSINIHFVEANTEKLQVEYVLNRAVRSLQFRSTPDQSRTKFWKTESDQFELIHFAGNDVVRRIDGELFQIATFVVGIVDISLPNYYRPFSPLFERTNGIVVHTGQYFVCPDTCGNTPIIWQIEITAKNQNIVHFEGSSVSTGSWQDNGDGRSFYVGPKHPVESESLIAVIDPDLPVKLKTGLNVELPNLIDRLGKEFETIQTKPLVFATYNAGDPERKGFQGGVLNNTVFMHWWGPNLEQRINESDELWFAAHEIAHFYQHQGSKVDVDEEAWIHEGFAELMAANLLAQTNEDLEKYVQHRFNAAKADCATGLETTPLGKATRLKKFGLHYTCGLLLHRFIIQSSNERLSVFELWNRYRAAINRGMKPSKQTYLDIVKQVLQKEDFLILHAIIGPELTSNEVMNHFLESSTF